VYAVGNIRVFGGSKMTGQGGNILKVELRTHLGTITANVPVPPEGLQLSAIAVSVMGVADRVVATAVKEEVSPGLSVSCRKGCDACCRQAVPLSLPEAAMIGDIVMAMPRDRRMLVLERFERALERLQREGFAGRSLGPEPTMDDVQRLGIKYFKLGIPCPFLENGICSIYPYRPIACREYLVTSPAELCSDPGANDVRPVRLKASLTEALAHFAADLLGGPPVVIPLITALNFGDGPEQVINME
jgi:Fe-S-cluster containining protein